MLEWLEKYRDAEVEIHYLTDNNAYKDRGRVVDFGGGWLELFKPNAGENGETFAIPVTSIRLMKVLSSTRPQLEESHLLRAVDSPEFGADVERRKLGDERIEQESLNR